MEMGDLTQSFQTILTGLQALSSLTKKAKQQGVNEEFTRD